MSEIDDLMISTLFMGTAELLCYSYCVILFQRNCTLMFMCVLIFPGSELLVVVTLSTMSCLRTTDGSVVWHVSMPTR